MSDLSELDTLTRSKEGVAMVIVSPRSRLPMRNDDGSLMTVTLLGKHSDAFRAAVRQARLARAQKVRGNVPIDEDEQTDADNTLILTACTRDWTIQSLDRAPFPCTPANIEKLWADRRFLTLREVAMNFVLTESNFLPEPSSDSTPTLGISS